MTIPTGFDQVIVFLLLVLPGITFATARASFVGWRQQDTSASNRILEALFVGAIFDGFYLLLFGEYVSDVVAGRRDPIGEFNFWDTLLAIVLLLGVPALVGALRSLRFRPIRLKKLGGGTVRKLVSLNNYRPTPLAWDWVADRFLKRQFVRVRLPDGVFVGGWFAGHSYVSTFPQPHDMYVEVAWRLSPNGEFLDPVANSGGIWISVPEGSYVEWINEPEEEV
jgi:hypothetical protein